MDISKLPRFSNSPPPPPPEPPEDERERVAARSLGQGPEAWISIAIGIILMLMNRRFFQYLGHRLFDWEFTWRFRDADGQPLAYTQSLFFWNDLALVAFGAALVVEGLVLILAPRPGMILAALVLTLSATLLNLGVLVISFGPMGFQIMPALAVAFGIYIALHQWRLLSTLRGSPVRGAI